MKIEIAAATRKLLDFFIDSNRPNQTTIKNTLKLLGENKELTLTGQESISPEEIIRTCDILTVIDSLDLTPLTRIQKIELAKIRRGSVSWLAPHLEANLQQRQWITDTIQSQNIIDFPWDEIRPPSQGIAILYNFSPFQDTGASVASKRIRNLGVSVDVIGCSFLHKKKMDETIEKIAHPYVNQKYFLPLSPSWASWEPFKAFAKQSSELAEKFMQSGRDYKFIYTRAMWAPSHYAGYKFKLKNPNIKWIAEFSDPLSLDVEGLNRGTTIPEDEFSLEIINRIENSYGTLPEEKKTIFALAEYIAYAFADEIIFTNTHQKDTMLEHIHDNNLRSRVEKISTVDNHPTLPSEYYAVEKTNYAVDNSVLNLAYFGEFYSSRGITEVTSAMRSLPEPLASKVHLHVFTNYIPASKGNRRPRQLSKAQYDALVRRAHDGVGAQGLEERVHMNASLPYLEFLATTNLFDYLIVNDARSGTHHSINPYLPSKWSDYAGSTAKTWGFIEPGSVLSSKPIDIKTPVGDAWEARSKLWDMVVAKFPDIEKGIIR